MFCMVAFIVQKEFCLLLICHLLWVRGSIGMGWVPALALSCLGVHFSSLNFNFLACEMRVQWEAERAVGSVQWEKALVTTLSRGWRVAVFSQCQHVQPSFTVATHRLTVPLHLGIYQVAGKWVEVKDQEQRVSLGKGDVRKRRQQVQEHWGIKSHGVQHIR